jgi:hypothetical protein
MVTGPDRDYDKRNIFVVICDPDILWRLSAANMEATETMIPSG